MVIGFYRRVLSIIKIITTLFLCNSFGINQDFKEGYQIVRRQAETISALAAVPRIIFPEIKKLNEVLAMHKKLDNTKDIENYIISMEVINAGINCIKYLSEHHSIHLFVLLFLSNARALIAMTIDDIKFNEGFSEDVRIGLLETAHENYEVMSDAIKARSAFLNAPLPLTDEEIFASIDSISLPMANNKRKQVKKRYKPKEETFAKFSWQEFMLLEDFLEALAVLQKECIAQNFAKAIDFSKEIKQWTMVAFIRKNLHKGYLHILDFSNEYKKCELFIVITRIAYSLHDGIKNMAYHSVSTRKACDAFCMIGEKIFYHILIAFCAYDEEAKKNVVSAELKNIAKENYLFCVNYSRDLHNFPAYKLDCNESVLRYAISRQILSLYAIERAYLLD